MEKSTLRHLLQWVLDKNHLLESPCSDAITINEQLVIFFMTVRYKMSNRQSQERFQHGRHSIGKAFHNTLDALVKLHWELVRQPGSTGTGPGGIEIPREILADPKYL